MAQNKKGFLKNITSRLERNRLGELLVQRGRLTPEQLRQALAEQKNSRKALGELLTERGLTTKNQIRVTLFEQTAYRAIVACITVFIGLTSVGINQVQARTAFQQNAMIHKIAYQPRTTAPKASQAQKLFGTVEVGSSDISAFKKWTDILSKLDKVAFTTSKTQQFKHLSINEQVNAVNEYVNKIRYIEDKRNFGKNDYWATPAEFFARGGDCEDFAIAKYAILKQLGIPENKMRLAIVQDKIKNIPHAVLIVYTSNGPVLLDNQIKETAQVANIDRYKPIYSINANGWWRHLS